ncbi:MAG: CDP-alcohol phosphatidyltransferase family protein [Elusimicrobia bacterium]|nr:CDP-alcohol phosphatidyltransferase family protein [Elusimicrobiota bacterium]
MTDRLQVLLGPARDRPRIAFVPAVLRAAQRIAEDLSPQSIILLDAGPDFARDWSRQMAGLGAERVECAPPGGVAQRLAPGVPLLEVSSDGLPRDGSLRRFLSQARAEGRPARWMRQGKVLASFHPSPDSYAAGAGAAAGRDFEAGEEDWLSLQDADAVPRAERALFASLVKDTDGFLARFDRRMSVSLSRLLLRTPATPNAITAASLALGLLGAAWLAFGSYPFQVLGAFLLWFCCILDGCDGEVARLKLMCSKSGAAFDLGADHVAHMAIFVAIPFAVHTADPQAEVLLPGILMVAGMAVSMFTVWWLILRRPGRPFGATQLFFERVASRDYVYLIAFLAVIRKLHWFLWAAAFGIQVFNLALWCMALRRPADPERA